MRWLKADGDARLAARSTLPVKSHGADYEALSTWQERSATTIMTLMR